MYVSEELKYKVKNIPIMDVANLLKIQFSKESVAHCFIPWHTDKHPSLKFWPQKNRWKCFSCPSEEGQKGGDAITLVMVHEGLAYNEAVKWLANNFGIFTPNQFPKRAIRTTGLKRYTSPKAETPIRISSEVDSELMEWVVSVGKLSPEAKAFLFLERKYKETVIKERKIFSITDKYRFAEVLIKKFGEERAMSSKLIKPSKDGRFYSVLDDKCVVFPYFDNNSRVINLQSRKYIPCDKRYRYKFPPGLPIHLFNLDTISQVSIDNPLFIAEGVTDCLAMLSDGKNAVAIPGVHNLNPDDLWALRRHRLIICPDNDVAGNGLVKTLNDKYELNAGVMSVPPPHGDYCDYYIAKCNVSSEQ